MLKESKNYYQVKTTDNHSPYIRNNAHKNEIVEKKKAII